MLAVISPAKKLTFDINAAPFDGSTPLFLKEANALAAYARKLSRGDLRQMMKISDALADLNYRRFQDFKAKAGPQNTRQAIHAFAGDTYIGLDAASLSSADMKFAQNHLRILSGLYGILRPKDLIQPYRLEMGRRLATKRGTTLYDYWGERIAGAIDAELAGHKSPELINLASIEYFKVAKRKSLRAPVITMVFKEKKGDELKMIGLFAKRARGAMARYMIKNRIKKAEDLKSFDSDGYKFRPRLSDDANWVFTR